MNNELMILFARQIEKIAKKKIKIVAKDYWEDADLDLKDINGKPAGNVSIAADYFLSKENWAINADIEMIPAVMDGDNARLRFSDKEKVTDVIFSPAAVFTKIIWLSIPVERAKRFFGTDLKLDVAVLARMTDVVKRAGIVLQVLSDAIFADPGFGEDLILEYLPANAYIITESNGTIGIEKLNVYDAGFTGSPFSGIRIEDGTLKLVYCNDFAAEIAVDPVSEIEDDVQLTCRFFRKDLKRSLIL